MRSMYTAAVLSAIAARPGIRVAEIADVVDCEVDTVERAIAYELASGDVIREVVEVAHGRPTCAFRLKPPPAKQAEPAPAPIDRTKTKVQLAVEFLQSQPGQRATTVQVRSAMGLPADAAPNAYLKDALAGDVVRKEGGIWSLGVRPLHPRKARTAKSKRKPARAYLGEFMCALRANGELHLELGEVAAFRLTVEQTGQVRELLGRAA